ncbi:MAG: hypothetical protein KDA37_12205 [Planctomycetales bacterium]|nr:hypothetical protein [Planctomycetales bacterium]
MKRVDLIKKIESLGCERVRHGAKHDWYRNPQTKVSHLFPAIGRLKSRWPGGLSAC